MTQNISELPRIRAMIRSDGTGELVIDGVSSRVTAADEAGVREEIINRVTDAARAIDRAVRLTAEDEQGKSPLIVHPNGDVEDDGAFIPTSSEPGPASEPVSTAPAAVSAAVSASEDVELIALVVPAEQQKSGFDTAELQAAGLDDAGLGTAALDTATLKEAMRDADVIQQIEPAPSARAHVPPLTAFDGLVLDLDADTDDEDDQEQDLAASPFSAPRAATNLVGPAPVPGGTFAEVPADDPSIASAALAGGGPNLADFMNSRPPLVAGPALLGWQGTVRRLTGGLVSPAPGTGEMSHRAAVASVQRSLVGPRTIVVLNPKGGAHKTTATLLIAATFGIHRGGYTLAWDNNETMGTLGVRAQTAAHTNTAVDLLRDLDNFAYSSSARVGDLDNYVRNQGDARFDALASDLDPAGAASIDDVAFGKLHAALSRFYRVLIIDTGNNMRASNWEAAVDAADQLVVVSTIREDTAYGAASLLDGLRQKGHADKVAQAVTILASPAKTADRHLSVRLHDHFSKLTRTVVDVPYDSALVAGGSLNYDALAPRTREAWLVATAAIAEGL
ncbi:chromosome partitioning protein [Cryobacterium sp. TMT2-18-3]|uniref:MinD/ParA family ATP-binding protein n=1 Tax=unclassified Cryobacterium TaxID=2649013 RepID=UPI00106DA293|nr:MULTISPECIES: chromosome partitioning protein [unclassified Cryobacterium]TFC26202.1 chromosome partitioning protein [Cryobacterium sp. TMT2-18-2]TFC64619.1 chromosome partitioning protein [Cryobacterium sp. TMT2-18-3]